jgi:hypothetical protein
MPGVSGAKFSRESIPDCAVHASRKLRWNTHTLCEGDDNRTFVHADPPID